MEGEYMKQINKIILSAVGIMLVGVPMSGRAYYCNANTIEPHKTKDIKVYDQIEALGVQAKSCVLMDGSTGKVIIGKNEKMQLPMASMTKMMTMLLVMEEVEKGNISLNQKTIISEYSASQEGSECFLDEGKEYSVGELLKSVAVASANDSSVALAEVVSGSESAFVKKMNDRAKELKMKNTTYKNATGLDADGHVSTAEDMGRIIKELNKYDIIKKYASVWMYDMEHSGGRVTNLTNTNRLLKTNPDVVLAKTGHTDGAGYCITALGVRGNTSLIACVMGEENSKIRFEDANKLLNFGFSNYESKTIVDKDVSVGKIKVRGGNEASIEVYPEKDLAVLVIKGDKEMGEKNLNMIDEIIAPISPNKVVGEMLVLKDGEEYKVDIITKDGVEEKTFLDIVRDLH